MAFLFGGKVAITKTTDDILIPAGKVLKVNSQQVVATRLAHIANPSSGSTVDAEARTAINAILTAMETHGLTASS